MTWRQPLVIVDNVRKSYTQPWRFTRRGIRPAESAEALSGVSFTLHAGEICGLLGVNGAGKTTLIKILASLITPDSGKVHIHGAGQRHRTGKHPLLVGHVNTNDRSFYWRLSGRMNLEFFASLYGLSGDRKYRQVQGMLELVDMADCADIRFMNYSTGQKQRLALARALLTGPRVILLDEPTSSLDLISAADMRRFIREKLIQGTERTALWCTHNVREAQEVCDRVLVLHQGRIVADLSRTDLEQRLASARVHEFVLAPCTLDQLAAAGVTPKRYKRRRDRVEVELAVQRKALAALILNLLDHDIAIFGLQAKEASLEELFRQLVEGGQG